MEWMRMWAPEEHPSPAPFWKTLPGIFVMAVIATTALAGLVVAAAVLLSDNEPEAAPAPEVPRGAVGPREAEVVLSSPRDNAVVGECALFSGTTTLAPGQTLVLATRNLAHEDRVMYFNAVNDYETVAASAQWTGNAYFGSGDSSIGQTYEVHVFVVDLATVQRTLADLPAGDTWHATSLPPGSQVARTIHVQRVDGDGDCP